MLPGLGAYVSLACFAGRDEPGLAAGSLAPIYYDCLVLVITGFETFEVAVVFTSSFALVLLLTITPVPFDLVAGLF